MTREEESIRVRYVSSEPSLAHTRGALHRRDERFEVSTAPDAQTGLDRLSTSRIDCVVSDDELPGQDGLALLTEVRERDGDRPFVRYTALGSEEVASRAISAGVSDDAISATRSQI